MYWKISSCCWGDIGRWTQGGTLHLYPHTSKWIVHLRRGILAGSSSGSYQIRYRSSHARHFAIFLTARLIYWLHGFLNTMPCWWPRTFRTAEILTKARWWNFLSIGVWMVGRNLFNPLIWIIWCQFAPLNRGLRLSAKSWISLLQCWIVDFSFSPICNWPDATLEVVENDFGKGFRTCRKGHSRRHL